MKSSKYLIILAVGLVAIGVAAGVIYRATQQAADASFSYRIRAEYAGLPADDHELEGWLLGQPGVKMAAVSRDGNVLVVTYEQAADQPPFDVLPQCERLGYTGRGSFSSEMAIKDR